MISTINKEASQAVDYKEMTVTSPAFNNSDLIPAKYACEGANVNPPLDIDGIPHNAKTLVIIVSGTYDEKQEWAHWLAWNIPPVKHIKENRRMEIEGLNYFGRNRYEGPCPTGGLHKYNFKVYALDDFLHLHANTTKEELERTISEHIIGFGVLTGCYQKHVQSVG